MNRARNGQATPNVGKFLVAVIVIGLITTLSWLAAQHAATSAATGQQTYTSTMGGFSFAYPVGWTVTEGPAGVDDAILIVPASAAPSTANQFLMTLLVADNPDVSDPPTAMGNGTVVKLANGIGVWAATSAFATRLAASTGRTVCPELEITNADQSHFSYALPNGKYLAVIAGFCQGQGSTTSLTYQQQLATEDWQAAISLLNSIHLN